MSIYSGFATRSQQQTYDQYVCDLLFVLQKRILKFYQKVQADEQKFWTIFSQLYHQLSQMEKSKYLQPKLSIFVGDLLNFLKVKKEERDQDPEEDLKHFQRSLAIRVAREQKNLQEQAKMTKQSGMVNNFVRRQSFSFGKIKRQFDPAVLTSQNERNFTSSTVNNANKSQSFNNSFELKQQSKAHNLQQNDFMMIPRQKDKPKRIFSSKGVRNTKSYHQITEQNLINDAKIKFNLKNLHNNPEQHPAQQVVKQYLQKTNKNYLRGYRKRKVREESGQNDYKQFLKSKDNSRGR